MFFWAKYNTQTTFRFPMVKRGVVDLAATADWTPATGDTKVSKDGGNVANTTNNPSAVGGTGSIMWTLTLTATELSAAEINVQIVDSATKAVEDQVITIYTYGNASAKVQVDLSDAVRAGLTALPNANAAASGGLPILGANATAISFTAGMTISNAGGDALALSSSGSNGSGLAASGNGTGAGIKGTGGATGPGISGVGGATSGSGIKGTGSAGNSAGLEGAGQGSNAGLLVTGGATGNGLQAVGGATSGSAVKASGTAGNAIALELAGQGSAAGLSATGGATGEGIKAVGGATSGSAIKASGTAGNAIALELAGQGSAAGLSATGGATGAGIKAVGGGTSGDGINVTTTSGHGLNLAPVGTDKHGIFATGGNGGASDGVKAVAGTGGVPIRGDITGNVTGNLSGSVGSVTGAVGSVTGNVGGNVAGSVASVTARVTANVDQLGGGAQSLTDLKDFADTGYDPATHKVAGVVLTDTVTTYTGNTVQTGDAYARLGAPAGASVSADVAAVKSDTAAILDDTGTSGVVVAAASKTGYRLSATGVQDFWDFVVEGTAKAKEYFRLMAAALFAKLSGAATTTVTIRDVGDTKDRITATVDADGNRSAVTADGT